MVLPSGSEPGCSRDRGRGPQPAVRDVGGPTLRLPGNWRARIDRLATQVICCALTYMIAIWPVQAQQANVIVPDGRTQTNVQSSGTVTNITTSTVSGANGFNSFSQFGVGAGNTVNLQLPNGTQNLINIVRDAPAYVNGTLNSYKNGQIGGNVYFADPYGFVVGRSGVVNVGSLNVSTPTREFVDSVISPSGQINDGAVANLLAGTVPISPDGNIRIRGRVNAVDAVRLTGQSVFVGSRDTANREQATRFASTVNSRGLRSASGIVVRNGSIQIVAANDAKISGRLVARAKAGSTGGGDIVITAGNAIRIASTAKLDASSKTGNAGNIQLRAGKNLTLESGASFNASSATGDGGIVETSSFGTFNIANGIKINVGAPNGKAGTLLVDPTVTVIGDSSLDSGVTLSNTDVAAMVGGLANGGTLLIQASGEGSSITLAAHAVIDTRRLSNGVSTGNAFNVTLESPSIDIQAGAQILTQAVNSGTSYTNGDVRLIATLSDSQFVGASSATTEIKIGGTITAGNIYATATSTAVSSFSDSAQSMAELAAGTVIGAITGIGGGYVKAETSAKVTVESTAHLTASGAITLTASGSETASDPAIVASLIPGGSIVGAAVVVGIVNANVATQVQSGATISSGNFSAVATNSANIDILAQVLTLSTGVDGALAYSTGTVNTRATIDPGAVFNKVGTVTVAAQNNNSFSTAASSISAGTGTAAVAVAISDVSNNAVANLGASLPQAAGAGTVIVYSGSITSKNAVSASSTVGSNFITSAFTSKLYGGSSIGDLFSAGGKFDGTQAGQAAARDATISNARAGLTLALNLSSLTSSASIDNIAPDSNGNMVALGSAPNTPNIYSNGSVVVVSTLTDAGIRGSASSTVNNPDPTTTNTGSSSGASMALNVDQLTQSSNAYIGSGATISALEVGVRADMTSPITITWLDFDSFAAVTSHISGSFGVSGDILTSYADSTFDSSTLSPSATTLAGAVNYFEINSNTTAWIASGANVTQRGGGNCANGSSACWTTNFNAGLSGAPTSFSWADDVTVVATTTTSTINVGGNFSWLKLFGTTGGPGTKAFGGSANVSVFNTDTVAGIGAGAVVNANGSVGVSATTSDLIYAVSPTSGSGSGLGLNGIASVLMIDNHTSASVSNLAQVTTTQLSVDAQQNVSSFNVAGNVSTSSATGVGLVVALAQISMDTSAFIGDNSTVLALSGATGDDRNLTPSGAGYVSAPTVNVAALTIGRLTTVSVAATSANNTPDATFSSTFMSTSPNNDDYLAKIAAFFVDGGVAVLLKLTDIYNKLNSDVSGPVQGGNVTSGAGSASVDLTAVGTHATIAGATIRNGTGSASSVSVQALNNTIIDTASGSAALSKGAPGTSRTGAFAGAVAVTMSGDMTTATISSSTVTAHAVTVQALAGGESTSVAVALAVTSGSGSGTEASASVSLAEINNGTQALVDSSTLGDTATGGFANIAIIADQATKIGIGGGSLYGGLGFDSSTGFGVSMTYASIGDPSSGAAVSATLSNSKVQYTNNLTVEALDSSRIIAGAASGGGGANASGFAGSVIVTDIDPTILALITTAPAVTGTSAVTGGIVVAGDVSVHALSGSDTTLDAIIANAAFNANGGLTPTGNSGIDFSGAAVSPQSATGAAIIAVAGVIQASGGSNVGVSIVANRIGTSHEALIDGVTLTSSGGVVGVAARDDAEIVGVAIGVGASEGATAGNGSVAYNAINNSVIARIGHGSNTTDAQNTATASVTAAAVAVTADDSATIRGAAGAISINFAGKDAVGLSAAVNQIGTYIEASLAGAYVHAVNGLSNNSPLITGNLQAGSVLVSGSSNADIITVSIGAAITTGNNTSGPQLTPQQNLSALVASLAPGAPARGRSTPSPPPSVPSNGMSGAGSLALSTEDTEVHSTILDGGNGYGSSVTANDNVLVLSSNVDAIASYAGALSVSSHAGKGLGISVVVNTISSTTESRIDTSTVDAHGAGNAAAIDNGVLANAIDPSSSMTPATDPNLDNGTQSFKGIAVVATSKQTANTVSALFAASSSSVAIGANAVTNVMGGSTKAEALTSNLNKNLSAGQVSGVQVTASSASYANNLDVGVADSGSSGAGSIALTINTMNRTTEARVSSVDIGSTTVAAGAVGIKANAFQGTSSEVVGAAGSGSSGAFAGSSLANLFQSTTQAIYDHGTVYAGAMSVTASGLNGFFVAIGSGAIGSSAGVGATVLVATSNNTVNALVGDSDPATAATALNLAGELYIAAANTTKANSYAIVGALGGTAGVSAQFSGMFVNNNVDAEFRNSSATMSGTGVDGAVSVLANETDSLAPVVGGLAGGGSVGAGAAVNLVDFKSSTKALMAGATVHGATAVNVSSTSVRDINPITLTASIAGQLALAATVGVVLVGSGASSDEMSVLNAGATDGDSSSGTLGNAGAATGTNVVSGVGGGIDGISAQILNSDVTATSIAVTATSQMATRNIAGSLSIGIATGGIGAGVAYTTVSQRVTAEATGGSLTAGAIAISASAGDHGSGKAVQTLGAAGAGGLYFGLGAAVGKSIIDNTISATLGATTSGGASGATNGTVAVTASDSSSIASYGYGGSGGIAAVGLSLAFAQKSSHVTAGIAGGTHVTNMANVAVMATAAGSVSTETIAGAAGVLAGAGSSANSSDTEFVTAQIGDGANISAAGTGVLVYASGTPDVSAYSHGEAIGGVGIGVSSAISSAAMTVTADVGNSTTFSGGALTVSAIAAVPTGDHSAYANAIAAGGGTLYGLQGSYAEANNTTTVLAYGGTGITLPSANVSIAAENDTDQYAEATGAAFGYVAAGATITLAKSDGHTTAYLDTGVITAASNTGSLSIVATGIDTNVAKSTAGSGGLSAGAAAVSTTSTNSTVDASLKGDANATTPATLYVAGLGVRADHTTNYAATGDAFQASAIGASGGNATNTIVSTVNAGVGANLIVNSAGRDMNVIAADTVTKTGGGARAGSGGVAAGAATVSSSTVTQTVNSYVDGGTIFSLNDNPLTSLAKIHIGSFATLTAADTVSLTAGGLFAGGGATSTMSETATLGVRIDAAELFSAGGIDIGSAAILDASTGANANLYGLVTGAGASTSTVVTSHQTVNVAAGSRIEAWGPISIYAGQSNFAAAGGDGGAFSQITADATTVVYNYALIPINPTYDGNAEAYSYATLTLGNGSLVLGANNVFLGATQGGVSAQGKGTSYNPYLTLFSTEDHSDRSVSNADAANVLGIGDVIINGRVIAGIHNNDTIVVGVNGAVTLDTGLSCQSQSTCWTLTLEQVSDPSQFNPVMSYNHQTIQYSLTGGFSPYQDVLSQISALSGLTTTQVDAAIAGHQSITAVNDDTAGTKQRQVDTLIQQAPFASRGSGQVYAFNNILASAGNVSILAKNLYSTNNGSVSANGSPQISIDNQGIQFLALNALTVTAVTGGNVNFTGSAGESQSLGISFHRDTTGTQPLIRVSASYNTIDTNTGVAVYNGQPLVTTPDIYFNGAVTVVNGLLSITDLLGSVVATQSLTPLVMEMYVPKGAFTFNGGANSVYNLSGDVASQWDSSEFRPTDTLTAVEAAATRLGAYGSVYVGDTTTSHPDSSAHPYRYFYSNSGTTLQDSVVTNYSNADAIFTARMLSLYYNSGSLTSAIFLPMGQPLASQSALATAENTSSSNVVLAGWERHYYEDQAYGDGGHGGPFNCSGCGTYFQVIHLQPYALQPKTEPSTSISAGSLNFGKALIISADVININGTATVGQTSNYSVNIGADARDTINTILSHSDQLAAARSNAAAGKFVDLSGVVGTSASGDVKIGAQYNVLTNQIVLSSVVQGTGGYVYLNGKIISTSTSGGSQGNIIVNGGAGTVNVVNTSGFDLVTNTINTGVTDASVVQIVDHLKNQTRWYVYNAGAAAGQQVTTYQIDGVNTSAYTSAGVSVIGQSGPTGLEYDPAANMYYQWVDTATLTRPSNTQSNQYNWTFTNTGATGLNGWTRSAGTLVANVQSVQNGQTTGSLQGDNFQSVMTATGSYYLNSFSTGNACCGTDFGGTWNQQIYTSVTLTLTNTVKASFPIYVSFNGGGASTVNVNSTSSIVLNGPINNLQGTTTLNATGANSSITVASGAANAVVTGTTVTLNGQGGVGTAANPIPVQVFGGALTASSTDHDIAVRAAGSLAVNRVTVNSAYTNATTGKPEPRGDVYLTASGDITSAQAYSANSPIIVARSIELDSTAGAVGATLVFDGQGGTTLSANPIALQTWATTFANGTTDGGLLSSTSATGTYIVQPQGDVRLGYLIAPPANTTVPAVSSQGPVLIAALNGNIFNGIASGGLTTAQQQYLESVWASLGLVNGSGGQAVASYESMINAAYNDYWQLRNLAFAADGATYAISALGTNSIGAQLIAAGTLATGTDLNSADAQTAIRAEVFKRYNRDQYLLGLKTAVQIGDTVENIVGNQVAASLNTLKQQFNASRAANDQVDDPYAQIIATGALTAALTPAGYSSSFSYRIDQSSLLYSSLTSGSQWSLDQLRYTVGQGATGSPPSIASLPINVSGRQVMLYAPNGSIGSLAPDDTFSFTSVTSSNLTDAQKGLLATAGPGQLSVQVTEDPVTHIKTYDIAVKQQSLVIVSPRGPVAAKALNDIYLGSVSDGQDSAGDMLLGGIAASLFGPVAGAASAGVQTTASGGGQVQLHAVGSILGGVSGQVAISGNIANLTLTADNGSIGRSGADALQLALTGATVGQVDDAVAAQGIYIRQTTGDLVLGRVMAGQGSYAIELSATGSVYQLASFTDQTLFHISGSSLDVQAGGSVGFNGAALQPLQVKISGAITGSSVGAMEILSPQSDMVIGSASGTLTSGGALTLSTVAGSITINNDITASTGALTLLANAAVNFAAGTASDNIVAKSTAGAITLVAATLSMGDYSVLDAAGVLSVTTTGNATLGQLKSAASYAAAGNAASIIVSAGGITTGAILSNGDALTDLVTTGAGALVLLNGSSIGTATARVSIDGPLVTATATRGGMYLGAVVNLEATLLSAVAGNVDVTGTGTLNLDSVVAGTAGSAAGTFTADAAGALTIGTVTSTGSQTLHSAQNVTFTTLTTTGITGDVGDIGVTADAGFVQGTTVAANGSVSLVAATTNKGTTLGATNGSVTLMAGGLIDWATVNAGTTVNARSTSASITFGTVISGGTQTIRAANNVDFGSLTTNGVTGDVGDVGVTADAGFVQGTTVAANGSVSLIAATTNKGTTLGATNGSVTLMAGGLIDWATANAGTTVNARSTTDSINFGTVTSGGTQTIRAANNVDFGRLTTNGVTGDVGDVGVTADAGFVQGTTVAANGSVSLVAATTNKGTTLGATNGSVTLTAGGLIDWTTVNAGTAVNARSTGDNTHFGTVTSGGTQTIHADQNVAFNQLTTTGIPGDAGDVTVTADHGSINGGSVTANGDAFFASGQSVDVTTMRAGSATLSTPHNLTIGMLGVYRAMTLGADIINVTAKQLPSVPPVPLHVTVTGYQGGVATQANLTIDPPQVVVDHFSVVDSVVNVDSPSLTVTAGYVPGQMLLNTPAGQILLDNRSPGPVGGNNLQLYQPGGVFTMQQIGNANFSDTQVVYYDTTISSTIINYGGGDFTGASFVRNAPQDMRNGDLTNLEGLERSALMALYLGGVAEGRFGQGPIEVIGAGAAVNIDGLLPAGHNRKPRKGYRTTFRSSSVENHGLVSFASAAYGR